MQERKKEAKFKNLQKQFEALKSKYWKTKKELDIQSWAVQKTTTGSKVLVAELIHTNELLKKAQDLMGREVEELRLLEKNKNQFISIVSHEVKTPTAAIQGFADLLMNKDVIDDVKTRNEYLTYIRENTRNLTSLLNSILDISRIGLGTLKIDYKKESVTEIINSLRHEMDVIMKKKGIKPIYEIEKNLPVIYTDNKRLTQVLSNLINNAVHYTNKGGKITVQVKKEKNFVLFKVVDTGCGIAEDYLKKIFDKFYQVDSSQTRRYGGTGLGLALCKGIVESMGGKIWAISKIGVGSTFQFIVPINPKMKEGRTKWQKQ